MKTRIGTPAVLAVALACASLGGAAVAQAAPVTVKVRIEGATKTLFEGPVTTDVHAVTGDSTGPHQCDGTNGGANATPGPTATDALDDAVRHAGLTWAGSFDPSFSDFIINRIGPDSATSSRFWGYAVQGKQPTVGGCQFELSSGQEVLWAYDIFSDKHLLGLSGPKRVRAGKPFLVKVIDEQNGQPIAGARVGGQITNTQGIAFLRYRTAGVKRLKARRSDSLRSNQLAVKVLPARKKH